MFFESARKLLITYCTSKLILIVTPQVKLATLAAARASNQEEVFRTYHTQHTACQHQQLLQISGNHPLKDPKAASSVCLLRSLKKECDSSAEGHS